MASSNASAQEKRPRVVIIGAGFAGLSAARALAGAPADVIVIDRRNHHLFQPLLYQVATASLSPADIAAPIRSVLRGQSNASVMLARVSGIDLTARTVEASGRTIPYDWLVVATGARHAYFGHDEWERFAHGLKTVEDATSLRRRILLAFEMAESEPDAQERSRLLSFVVVGGGATGVEMAGAIAELARRALPPEFRRIDTRQARIILVEAGPRLLAGFDPRLSQKARCALAELGVEVRLGTAVMECDGCGVTLEGAGRLEARTVIWAAGVRASCAARWLGAAGDRAGRVLVGPDLSLPGHPEVFVIGDTAHAKGAGGEPLPGVAPVAKQQGAHVGRLIAKAVAGRSMPSREPFRYRDTGAMATIGRKKAVAAIGRLRLSGFPAWLLWSVAHIFFLIGFRNRMSVALNWAWAYVTFQRGTRLITGTEPDAEVERRAGQPAPHPSSMSAVSDGMRRVQGMA